MNYTEMLFNRDERLVDLLNQADSKNLELIVEINNREEEIKRLKEEYMILQNASDEVEEEKNKEIGRLTAESTKWESKFYDEAKKVDRAIEYIKENTVSYYTNLEHTNEEFELIGDPKELLEILDKVGSVKE